jgi:hypothetical protein
MPARRHGAPLLCMDSDGATVAESGDAGLLLSRRKHHRISEGCGVGAGDLNAPVLVAYGSLTTPVNVPPPVPGGTNTSPVVNPWPLIPA